MQAPTRVDSEDPSAPAAKAGSRTLEKSKSHAPRIREISRADSTARKLLLGCKESVRADAAGSNAWLCYGPWFEHSHIYVARELHKQPFEPSTWQRKIVPEKSTAKRFALDEPLPNREWGGNVHASQNLSRLTLRNMFSC